MKPKLPRPRLITAFAFLFCFALFLTFKSSFVSTAEPKPAALLAPSITATNNDALVVDADGDGIADPGDTIEYTVTINNGAAVGAGNDALGMTFTDTLDPNMTLVPGSVNSSPIAGNDSFNVTGNVSISVPDGASDLLANDVDPDTLNNTGLTASGGATSTNGGNVTINANGSFTYNPPAGFTGTDTFTYTVTDGNGATGTGTVTLNVSGMVWFINNTAAACTTLAAGCGRLSNPFSTLAAFAAINSGAAPNPQDNQNIFIYESATAYTGGVSLRAGQKLIGQDATATLAAITGITLPSFSAAFPAMNTGGATVNIQNAGGNGVGLNTNNTLRGFTASNSTGASISGTNFGTVTIDDLVIATNGQALSLTNGTVAGTGFSSINSTAGTNNIALTTVAGTVALGGGAISGASGTAFLVSGGTAAITYSGNITKTSAGQIINIGTHATGNITLSGTLTCNSSCTGINATANTSGTIDLSGATKTINTGTNPAVTLANNTGATINFSNGGLDIDTTTGAGFSATGGGTVSVTTGANPNTIDSGSGTALNVANTTIGASGLTFRSISANGGANGIVLNSTGSTGGLTVAGNGGNCTVATPTCTGGTIQNTTSHGINLTNTANAVFNSIRVTGADDSGINGATVNGFVLNNSLIDANGDSAATDDMGVELTDLTGTAAGGTNPTSITNTVIRNNFEFELSVTNSGSGTLTNLQMSGNTISADGFQPNHGNLFNFLSLGTGNMTLNLTSGTFTGNTDTSGGRIITATALQCDHSGTGGVMTCNVSGATVTNNNVGLQGSVAVNGQVVVDFNNNSIQGSRANAVNFFADANAPFTKTIKGRVRNNTIGTAATPNSGSVLGPAIRLQNEGSVGVTLAIENNTVQQTQSFQGFNANIGISIGTPLGGATTSLTVFNNSFSNIGSRAIAIQDNDQSTSTKPTVCVDMSSNFFGSGILGQAGDGSWVRIRELSGTVNVRQASPTTAVNAAELDDQQDNGNDATGTKYSISGTPTFNGGTCAQPPNFGAFVEEVDAAGSISESLLNLQDQSTQSPSEILALHAPFDKHLDKPETISPEAIAQAEIEAETDQPANASTFLTDASDLLSEIAGKLGAAIQPTVYSQGAKEEIPVSVSGETINVGPFTLPATKSVTIKFRATIDNVPGLAQVSNQGTVSGANFSNVLTDDPSVGGGADPTVTLVDRTLVSVTLSQNPSIVGQSVTFTATLTGSPAHAAGNPSGTVEFFDGATSLGTATATAGATNTATASVTVSNLSAGNHTITAQYSGGGQFNAGSGSLTGNPQVVSNTAVWDGSADTNWNTAANWTTNFAPLAGNDVDIPASGVTNNPTISVSDITVNSLSEASARTLTINSGRTLTVSGACTINGTLTVAGAFSCGTFAGTGTVNFTGAAAQNVPALTYNNLTINNATGVNLSGNSTVNGILTLTNGILNTGANTLTIGTSGTISRTSGHIVGTLKKDFGATGGFTFHVGDADGDYTPLAVNATAVSPGATLTTAVTDANMVGMSASKSISRYWTLTGANLTADLTFTYTNADVNGNEADYRVFKRVGNTVPVSQCASPCVNTAANTVSVTGVNNFSEWSAGEALAPTAASAAISGRIINVNGRGLRKVTVALTGGGLNEPRYAMTDAFGVFVFEGIPAGQNYVITPVSGRYRFLPDSRVLFVGDDVAGIDFAGALN